MIDRHVRVGDTKLKCVAEFTATATDGVVGNARRVLPVVWWSTVVPNSKSEGPSLHYFLKLCVLILQCRMELIEWNTVVAFSVVIGLMSHVQSEKSPLPWNRDALLDGGCRYRQPDVVRCLDLIRGARDKLRFTFMGDSRVRQMFFSFIEVPWHRWQSR